MKLRLLLILCLSILFIPNHTQAVESCDDEDIVAMDYTECDIMFHQMFNELAYYQHEFETPIQFDTAEGHYEIHAFDVIVRANKDIELHIFYDVDINNNHTPTNIYARQNDKDPTIILKSPIPRIDDYNDYRSFQPQDINDATGHIKATRVMKLTDYHQPITLYYKKGGLLRGDVELETINFSEALNFSDIPNKTVVISHPESHIETRNVFINILDIAREDDTIKVTYGATAKTLYNSERLVNNRYIQLVQETHPNAFTVLERVTDTPYEDDLDKNISFIGIPVGDTSKIVKVVKLYDDTSPLTLQIIDIPSGEVVYTEDLDEYLD